MDLAGNTTFLEVHQKSMELGCMQWVSVHITAQGADDRKENTKSNWSTGSNNNSLFVFGLKTFKTL
jgi:hypothetical protein